MKKTPIIIAVAVASALSIPTAAFAYGAANGHGTALMDATHNGAHVSEVVGNAGAHFVDNDGDGICDNRGQGHGNGYCDGTGAGNGNGTGADQGAGTGAQGGHHGAKGGHGRHHS